MSFFSMYQHCKQTFLRQIFYAINQRDIGLRQLILNHRVILANHAIKSWLTLLWERIQRWGYCLVFLIFSFMM